MKLKYKLLQYQVFIRSWNFGYPIGWGPTRLTKALFAIPRASIVPKNRTCPKKCKVYFRTNSAFDLSKAFYCVYLYAKHLTIFYFVKRWNFITEIFLNNTSFFKGDAKISSAIIRKKNVISIKVILFDLFPKTFIVLIVFELCMI